MTNKINPRALKFADKWGNNEAPKEETKPIRTKTSQPTGANLVFPDEVSNPSIFSYDGQHREFYQELIAKANELFKGTKAEIPVGNSGQVENMYSLKRFGLITAIHNNPQLRSHNFFPITPIQSEHLLKSGVITNNGDYWEDLGLVLYDTSQNGYNPKEAKELHDSLKKHRQDLGFSNSDLEQRLIIVSPGLEKDSDTLHGVKPVVLPGITLAYTHEVLAKVGKDLNFEGYCLNGGLPLIKQLEKGDRTLYMPDEIEDIGLRVFIRYLDSDLSAGKWNLVYPYAGGLVNFAPQARTQKV